MSGFDPIARLLLDENTQRVRSHLGKRSRIREAESVRSDTVGAATAGAAIEPHGAKVVSTCQVAPAGRRA